MIDEQLEDYERIVQHWIDSSDQNYKTMQNMLASKDNSWALFLGHLVIEKLLKAYYVKNIKKHAIFSHDLLRLAKKTDLDISEEYEEWLDEVTTFNLNARYDNYKQSFYNRCTDEFTMSWVEKINELRKWLKNLL